MAQEMCRSSVAGGGAELDGGPAREPQLGMDAPPINRHWRCDPTGVSGRSRSISGVGTREGSQWSRVRDFVDPARMVAILSSSVVMVGIGLTQRNWVMAGVGVIAGPVFLTIWLLARRLVEARDTDDGR